MNGFTFAMIAVAGRGWGGIKTIELDRETAQAPFAEGRIPIKTNTPYRNIVLIYRSTWVRKRCYSCDTQPLGTRP